MSLEGKNHLSNELASGVDVQHSLGSAVLQRKVSGAGHLCWNPSPSIAYMHCDHGQFLQPPYAWLLPPMH